MVAAHGVNSYDGSCPVRHADLPAELDGLLGLHHENFAFAVVATLTTNPVRQSWCSAMRTLVGIRFGEMPVGPTFAFAGLGRFFLGNCHFKFLQEFIQGKA
jgi:hypothetical protein